MRVLYEDNHLLVVYKPPGLLSQGDRSGDASLPDLARAYLKRRYRKPGRVYVGVVHRLDRPVSGIVVLARTSKAAGRLSRQFRERAVEKLYTAVVEGRPEPAEATLRHCLVKDRGRRVVSPAAGEGQRGREAELGYRLVETRGGLSLLEVRPRTGRSHQIRAQLATANLPIAGDGKYGSALRLPERRIALQAVSLAVEHPTRRETMRFDLPRELRLRLDDVAARARPRG